MSILEVKNLSHTYSPNTPFAKETLKDTNLSTDKGGFVGIIGHTGSRKPTLVQCLNGLIIPMQGDVLVDGVSLKKTRNPKEIRRRVGMVFQYPEYQLFEGAVVKDIAFGPKNLDLSSEEIRERVEKTLDRVQLSQDLKDRSPLELSGGQKRRMTITDILAMKPHVLILDEPTAGLNPHGRDEILSEINHLYQQGGITTFMVSHSMEEVAELAQGMTVTNRGQVAMDGTPREFFIQGKKLGKLSLTTPQVTKAMKELKSRGVDAATDTIVLGEAYREIKNYLKEVGHT